MITPRIVTAGVDPDPVSRQTLDQTAAALGRQAAGAAAVMDKAAPAP